MTTTEPTRLPRITLREPHFRRFEPDMGRACLGSVTVHPSSMGLNAASYMVGFREARRAYEIYAYPSQVIPPGYDLKQIRLLELGDGSVLLSNPRADLQRKYVTAAAQSAPSVTMKNGRAYPGALKEIPTVERRVTLEDYKPVLDSVAGGSLDPWTVLVLLQTPGTPDSIAVMETLKAVYPGLDFEALEEGFYRVT